MAQEMNLDVKEILTRLARLQADVEYIKSNMKLEDELKEEMKAWEETGAEDCANFLEKHNL
ncbi:hypothetical protein J4233_04530 [Candidatus Pacearchaeota archaeon]|nr:hypothetical protein [Candidatus Pacearchaeota archaeon]